MGEDIEKEIPKDEMSFFDHIDVLRWHIMRSAIAILVFSIAAFVFHRQIFDTVLFGLLKEDFPTYKLLCYLSDNYPGFEGMCIKGMNLTVINVDVAGQFSAAMSLSFICIGLSVRLFSHGALFYWFFERVFHIRKGGKQYYIGQLCRICEYLGNVMRYRIRTAYFVLFPY